MEATEAVGLGPILPCLCCGKLVNRALLESLDSVCPVGLGLWSRIRRISAIPSSMAAAVSTHTEYTLILWDRVWR